MIHINVPSLSPIEIVSYYPKAKRYYINAEPELKKWCVDNIKPDWVVIDAGAHIGYFTILFSRLANYVYAFEPTITYEMLLQNLVHNQVKNVTSIKKALGNKTGINTDFIYRRWGKDPEEMEYSFTTIDEFAIHLPRVDFIKIDVDSFDFEVMQGAQQVIKKFNPHISVEVNDEALSKRGYTSKQFLEWLQELGYKTDTFLDKENLQLFMNIS